jgi:D-glycero-D-manno-heptose 1,7-bisphosphate phosphatase
MKKQKAVFLDRDGTINREVDVLRNVRQLRLLPGVAGAIADLNRMGYLTVIVTNQPVIARGWLTERQVEHIHDILRARLIKGGAHIDAVYYCPHHPDANLKKYRKKCSCRKPKPGMLNAAIKRFSIDRANSFMVGDHAWDIMAGKAAKLRTILVRTSMRSSDPAHTHVKPDFVAKDLAAAVRIIKKYGT